MGIIIRNDFKNYVTDIDTINERLMTLTLKGKIDVTLIAAYAPTAIAPAEEKDNFYELLTKETNKYKKKGIMYIGSDLNAKLIHPGELEEGYGQYIFKEGPPVSEGQGVEDNRFRLQEYLLKTKTVLANTLYPKKPEQLITYKLDKASGNGPPYIKGKFDTIDYIIVHKKWRNTITDVHSDMAQELTPITSPL